MSPAQPPSPLFWQSSTSSLFPYTNKSYKKKQNEKKGWMEWR